MTTQGNASFLTDVLELIVFRLLKAEPPNGYGLTLRIQSISSDVLNVNAGSPGRWTAISAWRDPSPRFLHLRPTREGRTQC